MLGWTKVHKRQRKESTHTQTHSDKHNHQVVADHTLVSIYKWLDHPANAGNFPINRSLALRNRVTISAATCVSGAIRVRKVEDQWVFLDDCWNSQMVDVWFVEWHMPRKCKDQTLPIGRIGNPWSMDNPKDHSLFGFGLPGYTWYPKHPLKNGCCSWMTPNHSSLARWCFLTTPPPKKKIKNKKWKTWVGNDPIGRTYYFLKGWAKKPSTS